MAFEKEERLKELKSTMANAKREMKQLQREIEAENEYVKLNFSGTELMIQKVIADSVIDSINSLQQLARAKKVDFSLEGNPTGYDNTLQINFNSEEQQAILIHFDKKSLKVERVRTVKFDDDGRIDETFSNVKYKTAMDITKLLEPMETAKEKLISFNKVV